MKMCVVLGPVVSTVKHPAYLGQKLLMVAPIAPDGSTIGTSFLAVDRVQAGPGEHVLVMQEGNGVRQLFGEQILPIRSIIVGHIDDIHIPEA